MFVKDWFSAALALLMITTVPAVPVTSSSSARELVSPGSGRRRQVCERGIMRVAPFSAVKSSSIQIVLHTQ